MKIAVLLDVALCYMAVCYMALCYMAVCYLHFGGSCCLLVSNYPQYEGQRINMVSYPRRLIFINNSMKNLRSDQ